ncbi:unnamed protein product [Rhizoctonia solani]|uniref:Uncharacterized protein n=1 Tax=Rhizoctonia solani TaxID=456999 RepID=A0A8H2XX01_9AGAM|nr:unnamed protein product [Rhizoctonia solani]
MATTMGSHLSQFSNQGNDAFQDARHEMRQISGERVAHLDARYQELQEELDAESRALKSNQQGKRDLVALNVYLDAEVNQNNHSLRALSKELKDLEARQDLEGYSPQGTPEPEERATPSHEGGSQADGDSVSLTVIYEEETAPKIEKARKIGQVLGRIHCLKKDNEVCATQIEVRKEAAAKAFNESLEQKEKIAFLETIVAYEKTRKVTVQRNQADPGPPPYPHNRRRVE